LIYWFISKFHDHNDSIYIIDLLVDSIKFNNEEIEDLEIFQGETSNIDFCLRIEEEDLVLLTMTSSLKLEETIYVKSEKFYEKIYGNSSNFFGQMDWIERVNLEGLSLFLINNS